MAAPMAAAAALGFLGSKAMTFVAGVPPTSTSINPAAAASYQPATKPAAGSSTGALCAGAVLGFTGAAVSVKSRGRTTTAAFDPTSAIGVTQPMGYWDPCGLMKERVGKDGFQFKDEATFEKYRIAELKHGRVAMLAAVGMITTTVWKFPGFGDIPDGLAALETSAGGSGFGIIFLLAFYFETTNPKGDFNVPGPWAIDDEMKAKEIANGRLAMAGVMTLLITEYGDKATPTEQFANTLANISGSGGFYTIWALFIAAFAWTQPKASAEVAWSTENFLYSKGLLGEKPAALPAAAPAPVLPVAAESPYTDVNSFAHRLPAGPNQPQAATATKLPSGIYMVDLSMKTAASAKKVETAAAVAATA